MCDRAHSLCEQLIGKEDERDAQTAIKIRQEVANIRDCIEHRLPLRHGPAIQDGVGGQALRPVAQGPGQIATQSGGNYTEATWLWPAAQGPGQIAGQRGVEPAEQLGEVAQRGDQGQAGRRLRSAKSAFLMIAVAVNGAFILTALATWHRFALMIYGACILAIIMAAWGSTEN
jgi:hypothetical protein